MDQEHQALLALDLLSSQMNKYANKKLKPYGIKFNELNIIRFVNEANEPVYQKNNLSKFSIVTFNCCGNRFSVRGWRLAFGWEQSF